MNNDIEIAKLYREFEDALTDVLAENEFGLARHSRLFDVRTRLRSHPDFDPTAYKKAVYRAAVIASRDRVS